MYVAFLLLWLCVSRPHPVVFRNHYWQAWELNVVPKIEPMPSTCKVNAIHAALYYSPPHPPCGFLTFHSLLIVHSTLFWNYKCKCEGRYYLYQKDNILLYPEDVILFAISFFSILLSLRGFFFLIHRIGLFMLQCREMKKTNCIDLSTKMELWESQQTYEADNEEPELFMFRYSHFSHKQNQSVLERLFFLYSTQVPYSYSHQENREKSLKLTLKSGVRFLPPAHP